jgi:hypothetical protein
MDLIQASEEELSLSPSLNQSATTFRTLNGPGAFSMNLIRASEEGDDAF